MNKIIFTNGTFEVLHPGHLYLLNEAAKLGNYLIVGLNSDKSFKLNKKRDPIFNDTERKNALLNLKCVNDVHIFNEKIRNTYQKRSFSPSHG
jgi:D-beta-D-heptose 7-phosphate kinase/D-beta-D-heptose 1-phosphate adenosyltransferase